VVDGVKGPQKDHSADVTRVYYLDNLVHDDDGGLGRVIRSVRRLVIRKKLL